MTALIEVEGLEVALPRGPEGPRRALRGVDLALAPGERLGLLGEAGAGARILARALLRLLERPERIVDGRVRLAGEDMLALPIEAIRRIRGRHIGYVPPDPFTALDPRLSVGRQMTETLAVHGLARGRAAREEALALLQATGIPDPARTARARPGALEPWVLQHAVIALAFVARPEAVVAEEPGETLAPADRAAALDMLWGLSEARGTALVLATREAGVASAMTDRLAVLYAGRIVEAGPTRALAEAPRHPCTAALMAGEAEAPAEPMPGPGPLPEGCPYRARCSRAYARCYLERPELEREGDRAEACFLPIGGEPRWGD
jgi:oligopeptide/dipeptide ABC transporter ATP-binding protein